ncbi:dTDP-4-dehydrorhamnose 3,5-epimerase [hydrothermal vent metagenome]|uniref:dTDP-4-dehydrorhamnose 3,5-epimerase n=1 Tax=hydrothermal vent metagenome TaxID=652676 RepID=A0A3B0TZN0_9ZZZZ
MIEPTVFNDDRGVFFESYKKNKLEEAVGRPIDFVQDNHSVSKNGVLRGLHFQVGEHEQSKLVRVAKGEVLDVAVDLRKDSDTFGQHYKVRLSDSNKKNLFIPKGMAHGFLALSDEVIFAYKCDNYYHKTSERGIVYNDNTLAIDWEYPLDRLVLSEKDRELPSFKEVYP